MVPWFIRVHTRNGSSIGSAVLAQLMVVTNRQTHKPQNTGNNRPRLNIINVRGRSHIRFALLRCASKTQEAFLPALRSKAHRSREMPQKMPLFSVDQGSHLIHGSLVPRESIPQTAARLVHPFWHSSRL